jgi:hypothetical protein
MNSSLSRQRALAATILLSMSTLGCQPSERAVDLTPHTVTLDEDIEFGPGSLDLADLRQGLSEPRPTDPR